jgi:hypothetical protein
MRSEAPVEIWHKILKYAISVPLFFDPDPTETYGIDSIAKYSNEFPYRESERIRYSLRTVCKGWDAFLRQYAHRYVKLTDIYHNRIPNSVLPLAIRFEITPDTDCKCLLCLQNHGELGVKMLEQLEKAINLANDIYGLDQQWNIEILEGCLMRRGRVLHLFKNRVPRLAALVRIFGPTLALDTLSSNIRVLINEDSFEFPKLSLRLPNLTTLYLQKGLIDFSAKDWALPSLKHFTIEAFVDSFGRTIRERDNLLEILEALGRNLETLHFRSIMRPIPVPEKLWTVCPKLLRVQMPYKWSDVPPKAHPVHCFRISMEYLAQEIGYRDIREYLPKLSNDDVSKCDFEARLDVPWSKVTFFSDASTVQVMLFILDEYASCGVELKDYEGTSFQNFIVSVLRYYRKYLPLRRHRRYPRVEPLYF